MKRTSAGQLVAGLLVIGLAVTALLAADGSKSGSSPPAPGAGIGALIMWYVCSKRKADEIGGWLLYFYIQLYLGVIVTAVMLLASWQNYVPSTWSDNPSLYPLFLLSAAPQSLILLAQLAVAEKLRRSRSYRFVRVLRTVLWVELAAAGVGLVIDLSQFPDAIAFDMLAFIWPIVWLPYFYRSTRVKRVFQTRDWLLSSPAAYGAKGSPTPG